MDMNLFLDRIVDRKPLDQAVGVAVDPSRCDGHSGAVFQQDGAPPLKPIDELYVCLWPNCKTATKTLYDLKRHYEIVHQANPSTIFSCPFHDCRYHTTNAFNRKALLKSHLAQTHPNGKGWIIIDRSLTQKLVATCRNCRSRNFYGSIQSAIAHLTEVHFASNSTKRKLPDEGQRYIGLTVPLDPEDWIEEVDLDIVVHENQDRPKSEIHYSAFLDFIESEDARTSPRTKGRLNARTSSCVNLESLSEQSAEHATFTWEGLQEDKIIIKEEFDVPCVIKEKRRIGQDIEDNKQAVDVSSQPAKSEWPLDAAEQLSMNIFTMTSKQLGPDHPQTLMVLAHFSILLQTQGRYSEAERLNFNVTSAMEAILGPKHTATLILKINLTVIYRQQGRFADAEFLESQLMKLVWEMQSPKHLSGSHKQKSPKKGQQFHNSTVDRLRHRRAQQVTSSVDAHGGQDISKSIDQCNPRKRRCLPTPEDSPSLRPTNHHIKDTTPQGQAVTVLSEAEIDKKEIAFLPLRLGHPMLKKWAEVLPFLRREAKDILGKGNRGSVEFCSFQGEPSLCITCKKPSKVNRSLLEIRTVQWGFPAVISKGSPRRSWGLEDEEPRKSWAIPAVSARHKRRVDCGSSLGIISGPRKNEKVSLGGYLKLKYQDQPNWAFYAETVHHAVEPPQTSADPRGSDLSDTDEDESICSGMSNRWTPGIINCVLEGFQGDVNFCSPAIPDAIQAEKRRDQLNYICGLRPELKRTFQNQLAPELPSRDTTFGKGCWSSGLCEDDGSEMDWLLIGGLPPSRVGCNSIAEHPAFSPTRNPNPNGYGAYEQLPTDHVDGPAFEALMTAVEETDESPFASHESPYYFHVKGHGSESGLKDGFLNTALGFEFNGEDTVPRYSFHPRDRPGLGRPGDSGTWIFLENGKLLGQIHSYDRVKDLAYFTPIHKIFEHIKKVTGAIDVRLPEDLDYIRFGFNANDYGYDTPIEAVASPTASRQSVREDAMSFGAASTPLGLAMSPHIGTLKIWSP